MILKILKPSVRLITLLVTWGTTATLTALVKDCKGLLGTRFAFGVAEVRIA
jgi:hypothetical protein